MRKFCLLLSVALMTVGAGALAVADAPASYNKPARNILDVTAKASSAATSAR